MAIEISCSCGGRFKARDEHAGRKVKCPRCQQVLVVSQPAPQPVSPSVAAVEVACPCGGRFKARAEHAGRKVKCPRCAQILVVPTSATGAAPVPETPPVTDTAVFTNFFDEALNESAVASAASRKEQEVASYENESPYNSYGTYGRDSDMEETSHGIRVAIEVDCSIRQEMAVRKVVRDAFMQHLTVGKEHYQNGSVVVTVTHWEAIAERLTMSIYCTGQMNGRRISCHADIDNVSAIPRDQVWLSSLMSHFGGAIFYRKKLPGKIRAQAENCVDQLCVALDRAASVASNALSVDWFEPVRKGLLALTFILSPLIGYFLMHPTEGPGKHPMAGFLIVSVFIGGIILVASKAILLLMMPDRFFTGDPRGRRYLRRWLARGALQFKIHLLLLSVAIGFVTVLICQHMWPMMKKGL